MDTCETGVKIYAPNGIEISPHLYNELDTIIYQSIYNPDDIIVVEVLECEKCGDISLGWKRKGEYTDEDSDYTV